MHTGFDGHGLCEEAAEAQQGRDGAVPNQRSMAISAERPHFLKGVTLENVSREDERSEDVQTSIQPMKLEVDVFARG